MGGVCPPIRGRNFQKASQIFADIRPDLTIVVGDILSVATANTGAFDLVKSFLPHATKLNIETGPVVLATGTRVALGDEIGALTRAELVAVIIGKRPGLSAADNLRYNLLTIQPSVATMGTQLYLQHR